MNLLFALTTSTIVGSIIFIVLRLLQPVTGKIFSKSWHYYCLFIPIIFLLGGTHIVISITGSMPYPTTMPASPIPTPQETMMDIPFEFIRVPEFDGLVQDIPLQNSESEMGLTTPPPLANHLMFYLERAVPTMLVLWLLGAILSIVISTKKYLQYRCVLLQNARSVSDFDYKIPIVVSTTAHTPMLIGILKPMIVLPDMHFADNELKIVLAHEMVHYRRKDLLVKLMMLVANALHWFNPVVYALNRHLNIVCELSCDEKLVSEMDTKDRIFYGETILQVLQHSTAQRSLGSNVAFATNLCSSGKNFKRRLISMMNTKRMKKSVVALAVATGMLVIGGGFALSNILGSAMPVYASEEAENNAALGAASYYTYFSSSVREDAFFLHETQAVIEDSYTEALANFLSQFRSIDAIGLQEQFPNNFPLIAKELGADHDTALSKFDYETLQEFRTQYGIATRYFLLDINGDGVQEVLIEFVTNNFGSNSQEIVEWRTARHYFTGVVYATFNYVLFSYVDGEFEPITVPENVLQYSPDYLPLNQIGFRTLPLFRSHNQNTIMFYSCLHGQTSGDWHIELNGSDMTFSPINVIPFNQVEGW